MNFKDLKVGMRVRVSKGCEWVSKFSFEGVITSIQLDSFTIRWDAEDNLSSFYSSGWRQSHIDGDVLDFKRRQFEMDMSNLIDKGEAND